MNGEQYLFTLLNVLLSMKVGLEQAQIINMESMFSVSNLELVVSDYNPYCYQTLNMILCFIHVQVNVSGHGKNNYDRAMVRPWIFYI